MIEPTITAEDLTLYALGLLEGEEQTHVDAILRKSTAAREELANIRGDLALFALGAQQHTPPALTRQRLLKQVARERRTVPVDIAVQDSGRPHPVQTFRVERDSESQGRPELREKDGVPRRVTSAMTDSVVDPQAQALAGTPNTLPTRTFPSRSQQMRAAAAGPMAPSQPVQRGAEGVPGGAPETASATFSAGAASFTPEASGFSAERQTFSPDPQVFPREARSLPTSAPAHSVTMFEQHFAMDAVKVTREPELPPDPEAYSGRRRREPVDPLADVQDTFTPSSTAREENFGFSAFRDRDTESSRSAGFARWFGWGGWAVAAAVAVAALVALRDDFSLREQVSQQQTSLAAAEASGAKAETVLQTLQSTASQHFLLARTDSAPAPNGRVAYLPERGTLVFQGSNLETLQPYKTYELWLIPAGEGRQPVPAGLFKPDGHGYATVVLPQMPKGLVAANFGVTIEDEGGSATPTLPILLVGQQT